MGRRPPSFGSSLELLLDTICNTFGGIVFLAVLVIILLQRSGDALKSEPSSRVSDAQLIRMETELADALARLETLQRAIASQDALLETFSRNVDRRRVDELRSTKAARDELFRRRLAALQDNKKKQLEIFELEEHVASVDADRKTVEVDVEENKKALQSEINARTRSIRLPVQRSTQKTEIPIVLRYGRLYFLHEDGDARQIRRINTDDFVVIAEEDSTLRVTPKPYGGLPVDAQPQSSGSIRNRLARFDPADIYFAVGAWEDSFGDFSILRNILVEAGFEYRLLPIPEGDALHEGPAGNPLVQ